MSSNNNNNNNNNNNSNMDDTTTTGNGNGNSNSNSNGNSNNTTTGITTSSTSPDTSTSTNTSTVMKRKLRDNRRRRTSTFALDGTSSVVVAEPEIDNDTDADSDSNSSNSDNVNVNVNVISNNETTKLNNNNNNNKSSGINTTAVGTTGSTTSTTSGSNLTNTSTTTTTSDKGFVRDPIYIYSSLIAGIGSGVVSGIACAPLDLIKTRMQIWGSIAYQSSTQTSSSTQSISQTSSHLQRIPLNSTTTNTNNVVGIRTIYYMLQDIIKTEGIIGCFRGLGATLVTVPAFWGVYFPLYDDLKRYWLYHYPDHNIAIVHMGSAVTAGAISDVICNPMFVVRTRLQTAAVHASIVASNANSNTSSTNNKNNSVLSMRQTIQVLYKEGGIISFWRGMTANLLGLSHVAIQFPAYEYLKQQLLVQKIQNIQSSSSSHQQHNTALDLLLASATSKMIASIVTYPHEVIRSRMMDARTTITSSQQQSIQSIQSSIPKRLGFIETCKNIYKQEGMIGFYSGLPVSLIRVVPNTCVTFITYELFLRYSREHIFTNTSTTSNSSR